MNIVFMGTPDFAVPTLKALIDSKHTVVGVFSQPDKKKGRGHQVSFTPVKAVAVENNIPVFQPNSLRNEEAVSLMEELNPDLIVVVAYGKLLPLNILEMPPYGCINVHASLLPKYRGAGPIQWSVLNGEEKTGITTMYMAEGMDTGDMLLKCETPIGKNETASELHDRLSLMGGPLLLETLKALEEGTLIRIKQNDDEASHAPMLTKELAAIDFNRTAQEVHHQICGLSEWPCAQTSLNGKRLKIYKSEVVEAEAPITAGAIINLKQCIVGCGNQTAIKLVEVQYEGSKRMGGPDFLRGQRVQLGDKLGEL